MIWKIPHEMNTVQKTKYSYKSTVLWFSCCWMYRLVYLYFFEHLGISISINSNCSFIEHIVENNDLTDSFEFWKSLIKLKWHLHFLISKEAERVNRSVAQGLGLRPFVKFSSALWSVRAETPQLNIHTTLAVDVNVEVGWKFCVREASRTLALFWAGSGCQCQHHLGMSVSWGYQLPEWSNTKSKIWWSQEMLSELETRPGDIRDRCMLSWQARHNTSHAVMTWVSQA